jgi:hypothetical protein
VSSSACAAVLVTPGFVRARMFTVRDFGSASQLRPSEDGVMRVALARATITSGVSDASVLAAPVKPFGLTPMIVTGTSFSLIVRPRTAGERANACAQNGMKREDASDRFSGANPHVMPIRRFLQSVSYRVRYARAEIRDALSYV